MFLKHKAIRQAKKIWICVKNLYRPDIDVIYTKLPTIGKCEKSMQLNLDREMDLHVGENEPQDVE